MRRIASVFAAFSLIHATIVAAAAPCEPDTASPQHRVPAHAAPIHEQHNAHAPEQRVPHHVPAHDIGCCQAAHSCGTAFTTGDERAIDPSRSVSSALAPSGALARIGPSFPPDPPPPRA